MAGGSTLHEHITSTAAALSPSDAAVPQDGATPARSVAEGPVLDAANAELEASRGQVRLANLGHAERVAGVRAGSVYRVRSPPADLSDEAPGELFLAVSATDRTKYRVQHVVQASRTEVVVAINEVPPIGPVMSLFNQSDPAQVAAAFVKYLDKCNTIGQAGAMLGAARLSAWSSEPVDGLNDDQRSAVGAIMSAGVAAVWGPPGTGKTRVIGAAVTRLLAAGKSVAIVSNTNVAVDQALLHVCRNAEPFEPGAILRVGHPTIPDIANHPLLSVATAV